MLSQCAFAHTGRFPVPFEDEEFSAVTCEELVNKSSIKVDLAKPDYYMRKHIRPESFTTLLENLASTNLEAVKRASAQLAALEKGFLIGSRNAYHKLPTIVKEAVDKELWELFRYRYPILNDSARITFFKNAGELQMALRHFEKLWAEDSSEILLYKGPGANGIATFNFAKDGTVYTVSICVRASQSCDSPGFLKTIHPLCGPQVISLKLNRFRRMTSEIRDRVRTSTEQSFSPDQLGYGPVPCG